MCYYDKVFGPECSTDEVHDAMGEPIVDAVVDGYNGTLFAYGQTASGKTYTLMGACGSHQLDASPSSFH